MEDYTKTTKRDFNPDLYMLHAGINDLSLDGTPEDSDDRKNQNNHFKHCAKRHLNRSKLYFNNCGNSVFVKNIRNFLSYLI